MPITYKVDILAALKDAGYTSYKIRADKLIGERAMTRIRAGELASWATLATVCKLLHCQPGDLLRYTDDESEPEGPEAVEPVPETVSEPEQTKDDRHGFTVGEAAHLQRVQITGRHATAEDLAEAVRRAKAAQKAELLAKYPDKRE